MSTYRASMATMVTLLCILLLSISVAPPELKEAPSTKASITPISVQRTVQNEASPAIEQSESEEIRALGQKALSKGPVPSLVGKIDMPFQEYRKFIAAKGGIIAVWHPEGQLLRVGKEPFKLIDSIDAFSARARDITDEVPSLLRHEWIKGARQRFSKAHMRVVTLLPEPLNQALIGYLSQAVERVNFRFEQVDQIRYRYQKVGHNFVLSVDEALVNGQSVPINKRFAL